MDKRTQSLLDEQARLLAEINEQITSIGTAAVFSEAICLMNLIEGMMAGNAREEIITSNPDLALSRAEKFLKRLNAGDESTLLVAESLSAKQFNKLAEMRWGTKVARAMVLGYFLGFELAAPKVKASDRLNGMIAHSRAIKFWSDLKKSVQAELSNRK